MLLLWISLRIGYPYELKWMEGAIVDETARVLSGQLSYHAPDLDHVPFLYMPLYYWAAAAVAAVVGQGYFALRLRLRAGDDRMPLAGLVDRAPRDRTPPGRPVRGRTVRHGCGWLQGW